MSHGYRELRRLVELEEFRNPYLVLETLPFKVLVKLVGKIFWRRLLSKLWGIKN
jgi:hypothetical protein